MGLFNPKWMSKDISKAIKAVEKITDPQKLAKVAVNAKLQTVIKKAIERIHDEAVLAGIALGNSGFYATRNALEGITRPDLLKQIADEAEMDWVRVAALKRLASQNQNIDLLPYQDLIKRCARDGNIDAVSICKDRVFLETIYLKTPQWPTMNKDQKSSVLLSVHERIDQLAYETIQRSRLSSELEHFANHYGIYPYYSDTVRNAARRKLYSLFLPKTASQEDLYKAALHNSAVRDEALSRLTDPELLAKIARNTRFSLGTRVQCATKAGIDNPFGPRTLVCPKYGKPAVYREMYESIDSWKIEADFRCSEYKEGCAWTNPDDPLSSFVVGDATINWEGILVFVCPSCGRKRKVNDTDVSAFQTPCVCGSAEKPIPVEYQFG